MNQGCAYTFLYLADLDAATEWFALALGREPRLRDEWLTIFDLAPGARLGLVGNNRGSQPARPGHAKGALVSLEVEDLAVEIARLRECGIIRPDVGLNSGYDGRTREFRLQGPEKYVLEFFEWVPGQKPAQLQPD